MNNKFGVKKTYYIGGYFLCIPEVKLTYGEDVEAGLIISGSSCVSNVIVNNNNIDVISNVNGISWLDEKDAHVIKYKKTTNLDDSKIKKLNEDISYYYSKGWFGYPYFFTELNVAKNVRDKYFSHLDDVYLLGIGIDETCYETFTNEEDINVGYEHYAIYSCLRNKKIMDVQNIIGYDVLGYQSGNIHSYLCNRAVDEYVIRNNIFVNDIGLFNNFDDASHLSTILYRGDLPCEQGLWLPWIVCRYF